MMLQKQEAWLSASRKTGMFWHPSNGKHSETESNGMKSPNDAAYLLKQDVPETQNVDG